VIEIFNNPEDIDERAKNRKGPYLFYFSVAGLSLFFSREYNS